MSNEIAISLPFVVDPYGAITSTTDQRKIWSDRVRSVIGTNLRERLMRPTFGTLVPSSFMETTDTAESLVSSEVGSAFAIQLPLLSLQSTDVSYDEYTNVLSVTITYDLPNSEQITTTIGMVTLDGSTPATQENL